MQERVKMEPHEYHFDEEDTFTKKRKHSPWAQNSNEALKGSLFQCYSNVSSDGKISLHITNQPERQHRARYQTEGSRGAVKDRSQSGFPTLELRGYEFAEKTALLQVFIGNDVGNPIPHIHYQACRVTGKNLTPCQEVKKEGTDVILIDFEPEKGNVIVCDCVGILKERHSDIEGKMAKQKQRVNWKKKSTKCRMVFRTEVELTNGKTEVLQVVSDPICCTQLPGTPEILKMSLATCSPSGGEELWMIGKNFMKDTIVTFQDQERTWVRSVHPNKEFFNATHLIVTIPPYFEQRLSHPLKILVTVNCVGKTSEPHLLAFLPSSPSNASNPELIAENGIGFQNLFPAINTASARPTILEPIENSPGVTSQNQVESLSNRVEKKIIQRSSKNSLCEEETTMFEYPVLRNRSMSDHRSKEMSQKLTDYRIHEAIIDDSSLPGGVGGNSRLTDDSDTSPVPIALQSSPTFQQRLSFSGIINPTNFSHAVESPVGVFNAPEAPVLSLPITHPPTVETPTNDKCNITFGKPGTEDATISIRLPPSVLENQEQLGNIVTTINKALTLSRENVDDKSSLAINTTSSTCQTADEAVTTADWNTIPEQSDATKKVRRVSSEAVQTTLATTSATNFINPLLANVFSHTSEASQETTDRSNAVLQSQQPNEQTQPTFLNQQTIFLTGQIVEEPPKKQKVAPGANPLMWESTTEKPGATSETNSILGMNNAWSNDPVAVTVNTMVAQLQESGYSQKPLTETNFTQKGPETPQQGMWHFPNASQPSSTTESRQPEEAGHKWDTVDAKPVSDQLRISQALSGQPQATALTPSDWSNFLSQNEKTEKWMPEEKIQPTWGNQNSVESVLTAPVITNPAVSTGHPTSIEMTPVNPKDVVLAPSPMDVDTYLFRSSQVTPSLQLN